MSPRQIVFEEAMPAFVPGRTAREVEQYFVARFERQAQLVQVMAVALTASRLAIGDMTAVLDGAMLYSEPGHPTVTGRRIEVGQGGATAFMFDFVDVRGGTHVILRWASWNVLSHVIPGNSPMARWALKREADALQRWARGG